MDSEERNAEFKAQEGLEYELVSDPGRELAAAVGILHDYGDYGQLARRVTFLLDEAGTILRVWEVHDVDTHPDDVLATVAELVRE